MVASWTWALHLQCHGFACTLLVPVYAETFTPDGLSIVQVMDAGLNAGAAIYGIGLPSLELQFLHAIVAAKAAVAHSVGGMVGAV